MFEKSTKPLKSFFRRHTANNSGADIVDVHTIVEQESSLEAIVAAIPNATAVFDRSLKIVGVNDSFLRMWGYRRAAEAIGSPLKKLWGKEAVTRTILDGLEKDGDWSGELAGIREVGQPIDVHVSARLTGPSSHTPGYIFMSLIDISERKQAEDLIRQSEVRLQSAQKIARLGSIEWNLTTGEQIWSQEIFDILGHEVGTIEPSSDVLVESIHPEDRAQAIKIVSEAIASNSPRVENQQRIVQPNGEIRHVVIRGEIAESLGILTYTVLDITDRVQAEQKILQQSLVVDSMSDGMALMDENDIIQAVNPAFEEILGYSPAEVVGIVSASQLRDTLATTEMSMKELAEAFEDPGYFREELEIVDKNGRKLNIEVSQFPLNDSSNTEGSRVAVFRDVTVHAKTEQAVVESEARFRAAAEAAADLIYEINSDDIVTFVSKTDEERGTAPGPIQIGSNYLEGLRQFRDQGGDINVDVIDRALALTEGHQPFRDFNNTLTYADGTTRSWSISGVPRFDEDGTYRGYTLAQRDISEQVAANQKIRQQSLVTEHMTDGIMVLNEDGIIQSVNDAFEKITGYSSDELVGLTGRTEFRKKVGLAPLRSDEIEEGFEEQGFRRQETQITRKDGQPIHVEITVFPIVDAPDSSATRVAVVSDIDQRIKAELDHRESEARFRVLVEFAPEAITMLDVDTGLYVDVNPMAEVLHGHPRAELIGKMGPGDLSPEHQPDGRRSSEAAIEYLDQAQSGKFPRFEWVHRSSDGKEQLCEVSLAAMPDPNRRLVRASIVDITERKAAEYQRAELEDRLAQSQKMEAVGQLTGGIAHDFNNMLGALMLNIELLEVELENNPGAQGLLNSASAAVDSGAALTRRLLTFSRQQVLEVDIVNVNDVVDSLDDILKRTLLDSIELKKNLEPDPWLVQMDANQLENAILNLSINARDAMPDGGTLSIASTNYTMDAAEAVLLDKAETGDYVKVSVSDTGTGMSPDVLKRVLEPFFTTKDQGKGTGLGLSMVHGFVQQSKGAFNILSTEGEGTTMEMFFPKAFPDKQEDSVQKLAATAAEVTEEPAAVDAIGSVTEKEVILVVDDNLGIREIVVESLAILGYDVIAAASGPEAMELMEGTTIIPTLVLSDMVMPGGMTGLDIVAKMVERNPDCKAIIMSGYTDDNVSGREHLIKNLEYLSKPFSLSDLNKKIDQVLGDS